MNCLEGGNRFQGADIEPVQVIMKIFCIWLFLFINNEIIRKSRCCIILFTSHFWNILFLVFKRADYFVLGFMYFFFLSFVSHNKKEHICIMKYLCHHFVSMGLPMYSVLWSDRVEYYPLISYFKMKFVWSVVSKWSVVKNKCKAVIIVICVWQTNLW